ncbi:hypothetical protein PEDI_37990 [Persicobacter diffluens]|uniref:Uncharacterized protein n=1 Tax=Persicobacter diffluens TaxID=981 RepID=A0AAN4W198_9BACT|nr:hypothetical protein PEDI_37990 [Persicobacter diffluens]
MNFPKTPKTGSIRYKFDEIAYYGDMTFFIAGSIQVWLYELIQLRVFLLSPYYSNLCGIRNKSKLNYYSRLWRFKNNICCLSISYGVFIRGNQITVFNGKIFFVFSYSASYNLCDICCPIIGGNFSNNPLYSEEVNGLILVKLMRNFM